MQRMIVSAVAALMFAAYPLCDVAAQVFAPRGPDDALVVTSLQGGVLLPTTELPDGGSYESGPAFGGTLALFPLRHFGFRGHVATSVNKGVQGGGEFPFSSAAAHAGRVYVYGGDAVVRAPLGMITPYVAAGPGGKSWRWEIQRPYPGRTAFAWSYAGGVDIRAMDRFGVQLEGRYHRSRYLWHGLSQTGACCSFEQEGVYEEKPPLVSDFIISVGVTTHW